MAQRAFAPTPFFQEELQLKWLGVAEYSSAMIEIDAPACAQSTRLHRQQSRSSSTAMEV